MRNVMPAVTRRRLLQMMAAGVCLAQAGPLLAATAAGATPMLTKKIPSSGEALPVIGLGTWQTFDVGPQAAERAPLLEVLREFAALGGKLIDSSPMYGNAELVAGDLMAALSLRPRLFVATKVWTSGQAAGVQQMQASLAKLRADPVDLMQVHNLVDADTQLATLAQWKREGRVRYIGLTHYTASGHDAVAQLIASHPVDFIQINYSIAEREAERRLLPLALERGIAVIANRPFGGGDLVRRLRDRPLPPWAGELGCSSWAQLLLKYVVAAPALTCAIPATSKVRHLRDNMGAGRGPLPDARQRAQIAAAAR